LTEPGAWPSAKFMVLAPPATEELPLADEDHFLKLAIYGSCGIGGNAETKADAVALGVHHRFDDGPIPI